MKTNFGHNIFYFLNFALPILFTVNVFATDVVKIVESKCVRCHQMNGQSFVDEVVTLSGQNSDYLFNQLYRFKTGERKERLLYVMNDIAAQLSEEEMRMLADYFQLQKPLHVALPEKLNEEQLKLYNQGMAFKDVCLSCHTDAESNPVVKTDWPKISGQNQPALEIQLQAFASGKRINPMMGFMKLPPFNDPKIQRAISYYFSLQRSPLNQGKN